MVPCFISLVVACLDIVFNCHREHRTNPDNPALQSRKAALRRSLFTIGVLCKHFDFDSEEMGMKIQAANSIQDLVFEQLMYFLWHEDETIRQQALTGLGRRSFPVIINSSSCYCTDKIESPDLLTLTISKAQTQLTLWSSPWAHEAYSRSWYSSKSSVYFLTAAYICRSVL